ncbi:MAG: T9SS type A sorting domain-containing protein, partial [Bacteroidota bacterium]
SGTVPNTTWGYGKLDLLQAMVKALNLPDPVVRTILSYDRAVLTHQNFTLTSSNKFAVRFTPTTSGKVTGCFVRLRRYADNAITGTGPLQCEIFADAGGLPGSKLGPTVNVPFSQLSTGIVNFIDLLPADVTVAAGTDYHVVLSVSSASDALVIAGDDGGSTSGRSSVWNGSQWSDFADPASGFSGSTATANLRVGSVVTTGQSSQALFAPVLVSPPNESLNQPTTLTLNWNPVQGAASYRLRLSTRLDFTTVELDDSTITGTARQVGPLQTKTTYYWRVKSQSALETSPFSEIRSFTTLTPIPTAYSLKQNFPNPFNAGTIIQYDLPVSGRVELVVFDILGKKVAVLVDQEQAAGSYEIQWNGTSSGGERLATGVYAYRLGSNDYRSVNKLMILK